MRLSHITIVGFKSFAKKVTVDVTHNVTGVVGPNGSGKSNVAEAIRFVLGEQSMKSMRGKLGSDLIFKGSNHLGAMSRASVTMTIDNRDKSHYDASHISQDLAPYLAYDELVLSRVIFADGTSDYTLNDAKVRLKDVQELLSFAGIGSSAHTIINQGEADKILLAQPRERKEAIEDSLGLRVYHMRLNESERKLERTKIHLREVELLRKEITPHLHHLKKQVEKIESKELERQNLNRLLSIYLKREGRDLNEFKNKLNEKGSVSSLTLIAESIKKELDIAKTKEKKVEIVYSEGKDELREELKQLNQKKDEVTKSLGGLEAKKSYLQMDLEREEETTEIKVTQEELNTTKNDLNNHLNQAIENINNSKNEEALLEINKAKSVTVSFFDKNKVVRDEKESKYREELKGIEEKIKVTESEEKSLHSAIIAFQQKIENSNDEEKKELEREYEEEKKLLLLEAKLREFESTIALRRQEEEEYRLRKERFDSLLDEGLMIVGRELQNYQNFVLNEEDEKMDSVVLMRAIDKSRFRIEEAGVVNAPEVMEEYKLVSEREEYFKKEIEDILETEKKLQELIFDLENTLETRFADGVKEISKLFTQYFSEVFEGGKASISVVTLSKLDEAGEEIKETGIEINVSLPSKKVKELAMFSGGERALVSIALLFAMSSITPPPFMVLDETDAPLDESNARKYGAMMKRLAEKSKLLVITHNRETMNHCDMLYGVTLGAEGCSRLLSIDFKGGEELTK